MAYPTSLDTSSNLPTNFANGNAFPATVANTIDTAVLALENKLGITASSPTTVGNVLTVTASGQTAWQAPATSGGSSGNATSINGVTINGTPSNGQIIIASSGTAAAWGSINPSNVAPRIVTGTYSSTITPVGTTTDIFRVILTASGATVNVPSGTPFNGQAIEIHLIQDASGSRTVSWGTGFNFGSAGAPTLSTTANKKDKLGFRYDSSSSTWDFYGAAQGL